jgi:uncharacterized membrane protein YuzA (DUF378 family)
MVEYALLTAGTSVRVMYSQAVTSVGSINWVIVGALVLALITCRMVFTPRV